MPAELNKALVRRFYEQIDQGNLNILDEIVAEDYIDTILYLSPASHAGVKA